MDVTQGQAYSKIYDGRYARTYGLRQRELTDPSRVKSGSKPNPVVCRATAETRDPGASNAPSPVDFVSVLCLCPSSASAEPFGAPVFPLTSWFKS